MVYVEELVLILPLSLCFWQIGQVEVTYPVTMKAKVFPPLFVEETFQIFFALTCNLKEAVDYILSEGPKRDQGCLGVSEAHLSG